MILAEPVLTARKPSEMEAVLLLPEISDQKSRAIAGIHLEERALRILLRGGFARVTVVADERPKHWLRLEKSGLIRLLEVWTSGSRAALLIRADTAFERSFPVKLATRASGGETTVYCGKVGLELAVVLNPDEKPLEVRARDFEAVVAGLKSRGAEIRTLSPEWICQIVESSEEARQFHLRIEKTIIKSSDDLFARWNRRMSVPLSRVLAQLPITPNQVTFFTLSVALVGAYCLSQGNYWPMLLGAVLTQLSSILDGNDGELARLKIQDSDFGTWLDTLCDYVSYFLTFGAIGWGLYARNSEIYYLILVGLFFVGLAIAMPLLAYFRKNHTPGEASSFKRKVKKTLEIRESQNSWSYISARTHHFATRATFSYFVLIFGLIDGWSVLLHLAAYGSHLFWIAIVYHARFLKEDI